MLGLKRKPRGRPRRGARATVTVNESQVDVYGRVGSLAVVYTDGVNALYVNGERVGDEDIRRGWVKV